MKAYVQFNYLLSDYAEVCSFKDQVVGFLFGLTDKKHTVYLYTDVESNWKFYDIYGFRKYREFHDYELSFLRGKKTMSFLYYKTINHAVIKLV